MRGAKRAAQWEGTTARAGRQCGVADVDRAPHYLVQALFGGVGMSRTDVGSLARLAGMALCAVICLAFPARAQDPVQGQGQAANRSATPPSELSSSTLTGDWGGERTWLHNAGVDINSGIKQEVDGNVYGGLPHGWGQAGEFDIGVSMDAGKLLGIAGGTFQATITQRWGLLPPGNLLQESLEVAGRGNIARLTEFWWRQELFNDQLTVKFGRLPQGEFAAFPCEFFNLTFCGPPPGDIVGNYIFDWPITQWAAWARYNFSDYDVMVGAYEVNPQDLDLKFEPGLFCCATGVDPRVEFGWSPKFGPQGLQGHYQAGAWYDTSGGPDVLAGVNGQPFALTGLPPLERQGRYGFYIQGLQQITGSASYNSHDGWTNKSGLSFFFNFTQADRETATLDQQASFGLFYAAPFTIRPDDAIGAVFGWTDFNSRAAEALRLATPGVATPGREYPSEFYYKIQVTPWFDLRPDLQYIVHPGGYANLKNETIVGFKSDIKF
jgi:porin